MRLQFSYRVILVLLSAMHEEALAVCKLIDHSGTEVMALYYFAATQVAGGDLKQAILLNDRMLEIAEPENFIHWIAFGKFNKVRNQFLMGAGSKETLSDLVSKAHFAGKVAPASKASTMMTLGIVFHSIGQPEESLKFIEEGMHVLPAFTPEFLRIKAKTLFKLNQPAALEALQKAWEISCEKNLVLWKLKLVMDRISYAIDTGKSIQKDIDLLQKIIDSFAGEIEFQEVTAAKKILATKLNSKQDIESR
ncbi:MAG: hypothetical protein U5K54_09320 [Cytophagales bacterium]|nr:hypothetical protein [Cytophagales bacterium]